MRSMAIAAGLAAALAFVPSVAPSAAAADGGSDSARRAKRMAVACQRVPSALERTQKLQERLAAGADTRGSLAWLKARQAKAAANANPDRARMLATRLEFRQELAGILPDRLTWLRQAQAICDKRAVNPSTTTSGGASS